MTITMVKTPHGGEESTRNLSPDKSWERMVKYIDQPPENSRVFTMYPENAQKIMSEYNPGNRNPKEAKIRLYAEIMEEGRWVLNGETLIFSDKSFLRNGQNRLLACIRANKPFLSHVVFGIDDAAFSVMDRGKNRTPGDVLTIQGYENGDNLAAAIRWATLIREDRTKDRTTFEPETVLDLMEEFDKKTLQTLVKEAQWVRTNVSKQPVGLLAAIMYLNSEKAPEFVNTVIKSFKTGTWEKKYPVFRLAFNYLHRLADENNGRIHDVVRAAILVKAFNHARSPHGQKASKTMLKWNLNSNFPKIA